MYNLLMAGGSYWDERNTSSFEWDRFLVYTDEGLRAKFLPVSDATIKELTAFPTLFCYEFRTEPQSSRSTRFARIGSIINIRPRQSEVEFDYQYDNSIEPISMVKIVDLAWDFDINVNGYENYRSHWAVKDVDMFSILKRNGLVTETNPVAPGFAEQLRKLEADAPRPSAAKPKVFIVHGRDDGIKNEVGRWLARIGLHDIILHEEPNLGHTLISKFQTVAADVAFAVVIMTPDDVGGLAGEKQAYRARQNVIFELGFFIGKLSQKRVAALVVGDIEKPSDYDGIVFISYDKRGAWKLELAREFSALHIPFDPLKAF